jgi:VWFA-related protein
MDPVRRLRAAILVCCAVLCSCVVARLFAQQPKETSQQGGDFKIAVSVNSVLVPVVVRDAHGRAVGDLTQQDFALFDQDKPKAISGFTVQKRGGGEIQTAKVGNGSAPVTPAPSITVLNAPPPAPERFIAFLFDDLHFEPAELLRIKLVATKILGQTVGDADMAAVVTTSGTSSGLTRDRAVLEGAVEKISPHALYHSDPRACPPIDVYQADLIVNHHNVQAMDAAKEAYTTCAHVGGEEHPMGGSQTGGLAVGEDMGARMVRSAASQILEVNDRDVAVTLSTVKEFVRRMGKLPGQQRTVILVSPGFLTVTQNATREKSELLDLAARENVTISALDARGLYTTNMDASQLGSSSARDLMTGESQQYHSETMNMSEDVMAELANGSGGTFFHNSNDLAGGFKSLAQAPEYVYLLEMSLDKVKADGAFHHLKVKVDRDNVKVDSRRGYVAPQPPPKQKK